MTAQQPARHVMRRIEYEHNGERTTTFRCSCGGWDHDRFVRGETTTMAQIKERFAAHVARASR